MWSDRPTSEADAVIEPFIYREMASPANDCVPDALAVVEAQQPPASGLLTEQEAQARAQREYARGLSEGESRAQSAYAQSLVQAQTLAGSMASAFERERGSFFLRAEGEVVRLALAIARKILHREAQMDPLVLAGVARVALEQIAGGTIVRLVVHPSQVAAWQEFFSGQSGLDLKLEWMGDASLDPSQCRIESSVGSTSLSLEDQLSEIEQGFFDLLADKAERA